MIGNFLSSFWYLIPLGFLAGLVLLFKTPWFKGVFGEFLINFLSSKFLDRNTYHLIKNVTLPTGDEGTTQIDHVIVSVYGVFVIETKNMKGWIFGQEHHQMWTQQIFKHKSKFQNPLRQNYKHTKTLQSILNIELSKMHSLVVFVGDSTFKTPMPDNVITLFGYLKYIRSKTKRKLTEDEVYRAIRAIEDVRLAPSLKTSREHVRHVKEIVARKEAERVRSAEKASNVVDIKSRRSAK